MDKTVIKVPVPIKTPRLTLRPPQKGDGQAMYDAKVESLRELREFMSWAMAEPSIEADEKRMQEKSEDFKKREDLMMLAFDEHNKMVGSTGLHFIDWELRSFCIGYWVRTSETGKGYATEVTTALARYAFQALDARRVFIFHHIDNKASEAVIKKVGFPFEGVHRNGILGNDGKAHDEKSYAFISLDEVPPIDVRW